MNSRNKRIFKFFIFLYKPVRFYVILMVTCMILSKVFNLIKSYIIKGIIDLPLKTGFQLSDFIFSYYYFNDSNYY